MNQTASRCLAALLIAAWTAGAPLPAAALNPNPATGSTQTQTLTLAPQQAQAQAHPTPTPARLAQAETPPPATKPGKRQTYPFRGKVATIDTTARTVTLEGKTSRRVITVTDDTRLIRDGSATTLDSLKAGEAVGGTLRKSPEGQEVATLIRVGTKPDAKPKTGDPTPAPSTATTGAAPAQPGDS